MAYTTIDDPGLYFNTVLISGDSGTQAITGVGFQPDFSWNKTRNAVDNHVLVDSVRGDKALRSNSAVAEYDTGVSWQFNSDGFTMTGTTGELNYSGRTYASWNWKAGTSFTNDASATSIGTIDSAGSVNTDAGFSIVSYTGNGTAGATIKHGLSTAPQVVLIKRRSAAGQWVMGHGSLGFTKFLELDLTGGEQTSTLRFNDTAPTSSVFTVGSTADTNQNGTTLIAYCFADIQGYSKVSGSYVGNGSTDGPMIWTGFKPAFVIIKNISSSQNWVMFDSKRPGFNVTNDIMYPNITDAETDETSLDFLSNGFKIRSSGNDRNGSGNTLIYMCFAEAPFVTSTGVPATAR
jgi:hypothetical protein